MTLAVLVVSDDYLEGEPAQAQTLVFGHNGEIQLYHRVSNGGKGRGQAWRKSDLSDLSDNTITHEPIAVMVSERDLEMLHFGQITNLGIKAVNALENASPDTSGEPHNLTVASIAKAIEEGDQELANLIADKRRTNGVVIKPLVKEALSTVSALAHNKLLSLRAQDYREDVPTSDNPMTLVSQMVSVPDPKWAKQYINRKVMGNITDFEIFDYALATDKNVLIEGPAGSGKTMAVQSYASARNMRYFNVSCHIGLEVSHLVGRWIPTADGHFKWQDGAVTEIVRNGGVLLFNEINFMPERFSTFIFSLLDYRREIQLMENGGEIIKAHPDLLIVADMNPNYRGTRPLNQAFADRFAERLDFPYDKAIEMKILKNKAIIEMANQLRDEYDKRNLATPVSTRSLVAFLENAKQFGMDFATYSYVNTFNGETERNSVRLVVNTHRDNISMELGLSTPTLTVTEEVEVIDSPTLSISDMYSQMLQANYASNI